MVAFTACVNREPASAGYLLRTPRSGWGDKNRQDPPVIVYQAATVVDGGCGPIVCDKGETAL